ncbi:MAG TPA: YqgE/AlgH family protein [Ohtaekwangia sp.]|uniref:YqgE/AlgH family protein n=1 Tax=Ohtaekwangia sp. TaxID=2066019 RepID=UPI002F91D853
MEFFKYKNQLKPEKGRLLISEPFLPDPNFERTVVLLCEHNEEGSFGFVVNKPSILKVNEVMEDIKRLEGIVYVGGPVQQDTLHFLHRNLVLENAVQIIKDVYWGGDFEGLITQIDTGVVQSKDIRFYLGYSGWGPGQLETELEDDSWIVCDFATDELLFDTEPSMIWKKALDSMGGRFSIYSNYPVDPRMN